MWDPSIIGQVIEYFDLYSGAKKAGTTAGTKIVRWFTHDSMPKNPRVREASERLNEKPGEQNQSDFAERPETQGGQRRQLTVTLSGDETRNDDKIRPDKTKDAAGSGVSAVSSVRAFHRTALGQRLALLAGVTIQPFFQNYQTTHKWAWEGFSGWALFAGITSVLIFPLVYRRTFDRDQPALVQLGPIFAAGIGWQSLLSTVVKAATGGH